jgi:hypothetical protein
MGFGPGGLARARPLRWTDTRGRARPHAPRVQRRDDRIVADLVRDWAAAHGEAFELELTGPAGGHDRQGTGGPRLTVDAVELEVSGARPLAPALR